MTFREDSIKDGWSDWQLADRAVAIRRMKCYGGTLAAEVEPRLRAEFTADEVRRVDAYLAASLPDTDRLAAIETRLETATDDTRWLAEQLRIAWARLDMLRDRIDTGGSLMANGHVASAIGYVREVRELNG